LEILLLGSRLILSILFCVSGTAKLVDRQGTSQAIVGFGLPEGLARPLAVALPLAEVLASLMLLPLASSQLGGLLALSILLAFEIGIGSNLVRGRTPECHCFGQLHSKPLSWGLFARNLVFILLAGFVSTYGPGASAFSWMSDLTVGESVNLAVTAVIGLIMLSALRAVSHLSTDQSQLLEIVQGLKVLLEDESVQKAAFKGSSAEAPGQGLPVGSNAPAFALTSLGGPQVSLQQLTALGKWTLLIFVSPNCRPCGELLPMIQSWEGEHGQYLSIALVSKGSVEQVRKKYQDSPVKLVLLHGESGLADAYQASWTPAAVLIDPAGKIASPVRAGNEAIRELVGQLGRLRTSGRPVGFLPDISIGSSGLKLGDPAPSISALDLQGKQVSSEQFLGESRLLVFWSSTCPHCLRMQADFDRWTSDASQNAPGVLIVASGDEDLIRENFGHREFLTVLDNDRQIGLRYGIAGVPSGILIDSGGRIASSIASGAHQILDLAQVFHPEQVRQSLPAH
jgi:peroxiredoxin